MGKFTALSRDQQVLCVHCACWEVYPMGAPEPMINTFIILLITVLFDQAPSLCLADPQRGRVTCRCAIFLL